MNFLYFIAKLVGFIVYCVTVWWIGFGIRKKYKFKVGHKDYWAITGLVTLLLVIVGSIGVYGYQNDWRLEKILWTCAGLLSPSIFGLLGTIPIPIPGISIED